MVRFKVKIHVGDAEREGNGEMAVSVREDRQVEGNREVFELKMARRPIARDTLQMEKLTVEDKGCSCLWRNW